MHRYWPLLAGVFVLVLSPLGSAQVQPPVKGAPPLKPLATVNQQASYAIGLDFGQRLSRDNAPIDLEAIARGLRDGLTGGKPELTEEQIQLAMDKFLTDLKAKQIERAKEIGEKNKKDGEAYLAANARKPQVRTTASGLQYKVLKAGVAAGQAGAPPKKTDVVRVHYHGTFIDGSVFDSSVDRKEPATFRVDRVIAGWTEALQMMRPGDKFQLVIPSNLAYGEQGNRDIPPNAVLVFEVELLEIVK
jgi:FKBP-type peptidyl-prolyl cis-trans isomerase